jgi:malate synthase
MTKTITPTSHRAISFPVESPAEVEEILSEEAITFIADLSRKFSGRIDELLAARARRQQEIDNGTLPDFLQETAAIKNAEWKVGTIPADLTDRRVEITGPVDRKMVINALNSGAKVFMADFEDAHSPTWQGTIEGQVNMRDAVDGTIEYINENGKRYTLGKTLATLIVRPRGLHLHEKHFLVDGKPIYGSLFDFGLYFFHNAHTLLQKNSGPYFYIPKLEHYLEARLWNDIFIYAQEALSIPRGTIKATVLIETILATFQMEEILYEMKEHIVGLNCGRWDYIFSCIKKFNKYPGRIFPNRAQVTMATHFLSCYSQLLIQTCHKRGAYAMGGMAANIPVKNDPIANEAAFAKVKADKEREARNGHDGTWVAHPGLIPVAMEAFDRLMPGPNQLAVLRKDVSVTAEDLLRVPEGTITEEGVRNNVSVAVQYMASWLRGVGCVPIFNLMEDAATAEISRSQLWQWIKYPGGKFADGTKITTDLFRSILEEELEVIRIEVGDRDYANGHYERAAQIIDHIVTAKDFIEFLTLPAYKYIN